jgi:anti-anti-sigma regulatory factor
MENPAITLQSDLDLAAAATLKRMVVEVLDQGRGLAIDAADVQRVTSPCLQVLVAAVRKGAVVTGASSALIETAKLLDLAASLGLKEEGNG